MVADFAIIQKRHPFQRWTVEHKLNHLIRRGDMHSHTLYREEESNRIFKEGAQYDFFWTESSLGYAFVIPRDRIPLDWRTTNGKYTPSFGVESPLEEFRVRYDESSTWIDRLATIIGRYGNAVVPFQLCTSIPSKEAETDDHQHAVDEERLVQYDREDFSGNEYEDSEGESEFGDDESGDDDDYDAELESLSEEEEVIDMIDCFEVRDGGLNNGTNQHRKGITSRLAGRFLHELQAMAFKS